MNSSEEKILHGLYYHREIIGEAVLYNASELNWLANVSFTEGRKWLGSDNHLQSLEEQGNDFLTNFSRTRANPERSLSYLQANGFLSYTKEGLGAFRISLTGSGAETARELGTMIGRANLAYRKHKDGVVWFLATVLVSSVTALITKSCK